MRRMHGVGLGLLAFLLVLPTIASAQSQFTGQVRDESGGILPGVTVEAASPVLIEKAKTRGHRRPGPLHHRRLAAGRVQGHVHAHRLLDHRA